MQPAVPAWFRLALGCFVLTLSACRFHAEGLTPSSTPDGSVAADGGAADGGPGCGSLDGAALTPDPAAAAPVPDPTLANQQHHFFKISVRDATSQAPIPGAVFETTNRIAVTSDDNGIIAFYEPGLMGSSVWFSITHPGYQYPADAFGYHGLAIVVSEGGSATVLLQKTSGSAAGAQGDLQTRLAAGLVPTNGACSAIRVVDNANRRGVPLVELSAFGEDYWSDSQGLIAYCNPDHMGQSVAFSCFSHGYALASGNTTVSITTGKGAAIDIPLQRINVAERLYRVTGEGIYRDSILLGLQTPLKAPLLNAKVMGSDTGSTTMYKGQLFWMWQDTARVGYPLGNFSGTGGTSMLQTGGGLDADLGADVTYYVGSDGFAAPMTAAFAPTSDPVWIDGLVSVPDKNQVERLFGGYAQVNGSGASDDAGVMRFDDASHQFQRVVSGQQTSPVGHPNGHAFKFGDPQNPYVYYRARLRIPATAEAMADASRYEQFSPYGAAGATTLQKNPDGTLDYEWSAGATQVSSAQLKSAGVAADQSLDDHALDVDSGSSIAFSAVSIEWSEYRKRFILIGQQEFGTSFAGELWHAEADTPMGPWVYSKKVITHQDYTFYNPLHNPEFSRDGGRIIYFEGTYTSSYSGAKVLTPRYDYNQEMYRLDLQDARLALPVAIYDVGATMPGTFVDKRALRRGMARQMPAFYALDRAATNATPNALPVRWSGPSCAPRQLVVGQPATAEATTAPPLFYALPGTASPTPKNMVALYDYGNGAGAHAYSTNAALVLAGFARAPAPLAFVWANPVHVPLPVSDYLGSVVAVAGEDQCVAATSSAGAAVTLDGSGSSSLVGAVTHYRWTVDGASRCPAVTGARPTLTLPVGLHTIELEVTDGAGNVAHDALLVQVS